MKKEISIILPIHNEKDSLPIMVRLLESTIKFKKEIIIVHDSLNDNALEIAYELSNEFNDVYVVHNKIAKGVKYAVDAGVSESKYDKIIIFAVDEIFPIIAIDKMLDLLIQNDLDFINIDSDSEFSCFTTDYFFDHNQPLKYSKNYLLQINKSSVFDMECFAHAKVCHQHNIKFNAYKWVSDDGDFNSWNVNCKIGFDNFKEIFLQFFFGEY